MRMLVTGATGYIGTHLAFLAASRGHDVVIASRQQPASIIASWLHFDLASDETVVLPADTAVVVHLAANTTPTNLLDDECEVAAAQRLIKSTQEVGAKFIFVSSQTACIDAPTAYGRIKWRIEQEVLAVGGWIVRPGQVYGGELRGLFGMLAKAVQKLPLLPAFVPAPKVQPIHVDDLAEGLLRIAERDDVPRGVYCLAAPEPISFSKFLDEIAKSRLRCRRGFVPVPVVVINALAIVMGESMRTRLGVERLRSLFDLPVMETASDLRQLRLTLRPLRSGMHPSGNDRRRGLLREGRALLAYVLKEPPGSAALRRYIRAIERLRDGHALGMPKLFLSYPLFLSLLDKSAWTDEMVGAEFSWRLDAATMLAEATPSGAYRFLGLGHEYGRLRSLLFVGSAIVCEVFWRVLRTLFLPLTRFALGRARGAV